jgi:hypothetical protein
MNLSDHFPGKTLLAHVVYWYGKPNTTHNMNRYVSTDLKIIADQNLAMQALGIKGLFALTYGAASSFVQQAVIAANAQCNLDGQLFGLCIDPWAVRNSTDKTAAVIAYLKQADTQKMLNSKSYLPEHYVLDFNTKADPVKIHAALPGIKMLSKNSGFWWPNFPSDSSQSGVTIGGVCPCFNDGVIGNMGVSWQGGPTRFKESDGGNYWWDQASLIPPAVTYVQIITWNDYQERTVIEPMASMLWGRIGK